MEINSFESKIGEFIGVKAHQWAIIDARYLPFCDWVVSACKANYCGKYATTWTCPPGVGTLDELKAKALAFERALVFSTKHEIEDSFDIEGMGEGRERHERLTDEVVEFFAPNNIRALSAEGCGLCAKCTYPGAPCRYPNKARSSVEANGISVVDLAKICSINYHNGANTVTYFSVILF